MRSICITAPAAPFLVAATSMDIRLRLCDETGETSSRTGGDVIPKVILRHLPDCFRGVPCSTLRFLVNLGVWEQTQNKTKMNLLTYLQQRRSNKKCIRVRHYFLMTGFYAICWRIVIAQLLLFKFVDVFTYIVLVTNRFQNSAGQANKHFKKNSQYSIVYVDGSENNAQYFL